MRLVILTLSSIILSVGLNAQPFLQKNKESLFFVENIYNIERGLVYTVALIESKNFKSKAYKINNNPFNIRTDNWYRTFYVPTQDATNTCKTGLHDMIYYENVDYAIIHFGYLYRQVHPENAYESFRDRVQNLSQMFKISADMFLQVMVENNLLPTENTKRL